MLDFKAFRFFLHSAPAVSWTIIEGKVMCYHTSSTGTNDIWWSIEYLWYWRSWMIIVSRNCWSRSSVSESELLNGHQGKKVSQLLSLSPGISKRRSVRHCSPFCLCRTTTGSQSMWVFNSVQGWQILAILTYHKRYESVWLLYFAGFSAIILQ